MKKVTVALFLIVVLCGAVVSADDDSTPSREPPQGAPAYEASPRPSDGVNMALTVRKLTPGFDPPRPMLIWAIGSSIDSFDVFEPPHKIGSGHEEIKSFRYLRPVVSEFQRETEIVVQKRASATSITSVTHRVQTRLTLSASYDSDGQLKEAEVTLSRNGERQRAAVRSANGKANVTREDGRQFEFEIPADVIVTSAPDWTDAFSLMRRYDAAAGGEQEFAGLWIHPTRDPLRLTFRVQHLGVDTVQQQGAAHQLDRLLITLRGGSQYIGWRDKQHRLIRLKSARSTEPAIVLEGWEIVTAHLRTESK